MSRSFFLFVFLTTLFITGCSSLLTPEPLKTSLPSPEAPGNEWAIKMTHSGGIMGLSRSIDISSDGKYTATDNRAKKTITGNLTANELSKLNKIVYESKFESATKPQQSGCADCFIYSLEMQLNGKKVAYQADDITLSSSELVILVTYLRDLMDRALK
jgi:hypothetical protein